MTWDKWLNMLLGVWVAVVAFLGISMGTLQVVLALTGLVILAANVAGAGAESEEHTRTRAHA